MCAKTTEYSATVAVARAGGINRNIDSGIFMAGLQVHREAGSCTDSSVCQPRYIDPKQHRHAAGGLDIWFHTSAVPLDVSASRLLIPRTPMPNENLPLIVHSGSGLARVGPQGGRIVAEMVSGALALSREAEAISAGLVPRFKIGEHVFCEPDYQQVLLWAKALKLTPETVIDRLVNKAEGQFERRKETRFENGRIIKLDWDMRFLPLESFEWVGELVIESIEFANATNRPMEGILFLPLPALRFLKCAQLGLVKLDLSAVPLLTELRCDSNQLTELDLSAVPRLTELNCGKNRLVKLDLSDVAQLGKLYCGSNHLTSLDLSGVEMLAELSCGYNQFSELDLSIVPQLSVLSCEHNQLTSLDLSRVPQLTELNCTKNQLTKLDLSAVPHLNELWCDDNQLTDLNLTDVGQVTSLGCSGNQLTELDLSAVRQLETLYCGGNQLTELDLSEFSELWLLSCEDSLLTELDISRLENLEDLEYDFDTTRLIQRADQNFGTPSTSLSTEDGTSLTPQHTIGEHVFCEPDYEQVMLWSDALELEPETVIERLLAYRTATSEKENATQITNGRIVKLGWDIELLPLESFEWVDGLVIESIAFFVRSRPKSERTLSLPLPKLLSLKCEVMGLASLDLTAVPLLTELDCSDNRLSDLGLSAVSLLTELDCSDNRLSELDLSTVPLLIELDCSNNRLSELDLFAVPLLTKLECSDNPLSELDLSAVPLLTALDCSGNRLSELDLSAVPLLTKLWCPYNQITDLDIRPLKHLETLGYDADKTRLIQRPDQHF
jgi:hypothetical protein